MLKICFFFVLVFILYLYLYYIYNLYFLNMNLSSRHPSMRPTPSQRKQIRIPPAWTNVRISSSLPTAKIWAIGYDEKHRKQYIYNPRWTSSASTSKFQRIGRYLNRLFHIRNESRRILRHLLRHRPTHITRDFVLWIMVALLFETGMRVSSSIHADATGLTTLRPNHLHTNILQFIGKSKQPQRFVLSSSSLIRWLNILKTSKHPFLFTVNGTRITASDLNRFLHQHASVTAKDIRTVVANQRWFEIYSDKGASTDTDIKKKQHMALKSVADAIQHTPAICRKSYLHPRVWTMRTHYTTPDCALRRLFC